jgi:sulfur-oxidizing protein SoxX
VRPRSSAFAIYSKNHIFALKKILNVSKVKAGEGLAGSAQGQQGEDYTLMNGVKLFLAGVLLLPATIAMAAEIAPDAVAFEDNTVVASLSGNAGDPVAGAAVFKDRGLGNCLACHANKGMEKELFHGTVGPSMDGVADRWKPEELRAIVTDAKKVFGEETVMPGFYSLNVGINVRENLVGKTILNAQQVEDVVAYLATLKE